MQTLAGAGTWLEHHSWVPGTTGGAVFGIISVVLAIVLYRKGRERRTLDYRITSNVRILSRVASDVSDLQVSYKQYSLKDPRLVRMEIRNTGNKAITAEDFSDPIKITNKGDQRAIDIYLVKESYPNMVGDLFDAAAGNRYIRIKPRLLNRDDSFELQLLYEGDIDLDVSCHFKDQSRPMQKIREQRSGVTTWWGQAAPWFVVPPVLVVLGYRLQQDGSTLPHALTVLLIGYLIPLIPIAYKFIRKRLV